MKKIILCAVLLVCLGIGGAFAMDLTTYPDSVAANHPMFNLGIGFGNVWYGSLRIPPILFSMDWPIALGGLPFSLGAGVGIAQYGWSSDYKYTYLLINGRVAYHFNFDVPKLDTYVMAALGVRLAFEDYYGTSYTHAWFDFGAAIGVRYFFIPAVGAYAELGYTGLTYISLGVAFRI